MVRDIPDRWAVYRASALGDVTLITGVLAWWHKSRDARFTVIPVTPGPPTLRPSGVTRSSASPGGINGHTVAQVPRIAADMAGMAYSTARSLLSLALTLRGRPCAAITIRIARRIYNRIPLPVLDRA
jgi:hypothetical protein